MILDSITSADIKYNVFGKKFQDDVVLSHHIVDFQIGSNKVQTRNILSEHIQVDSITSDLIKDNTITSSKIPLQSIRTDNLTVVFKENGGTGQTEFDEFGVLFVTSSEAVSANSTVISIEDGHLGIGATDSEVSFLIQESASASVVFDSEDDNQTSLLLTHNSTSWNVHIDSEGI